MTPILDPVWPWSWVWEILQQLPSGTAYLALFAALAAVALPMLHLGRASRRVRRAAASAVLVALVLVARHTWGPVHAQCELAAGSGWAGLLAAAGQVALLGLLVAPGALCGLSLGTYLGTRGVTRGRLALLVGLRVLAFVLAMAAVLRPALGWVDLEQVRSQLLILLDTSRSMTVQDERNGLSRWDLTLQSLKAGAPALHRLREEQRVGVVFAAFDDGTRDFDPDSPGEPAGKRSEIGEGLRALFDRRDPRLNLRGVLLLSDGAGNGSVPALGEAMRWRSVGGAVHTFGSGSPRAARKQNDVAITSISTSPQPFVPVKGKLTVKLAVDAYGYENSKAAVRIYLEDKEVKVENATLALTTGNEVAVTVDAPATPGEYKVKAEVATSEEDPFPLNNVIETFVTVSKEGLLVLVVDRQRLEPLSICDALAPDPRIQVKPVWLRGRKAGGPQRSPFDDPFDVLILGDVTLEQLRSLDPDAPEKIREKVGGGAGLFVLGGYVNLGNGGWQDSALKDVLPVELSANAQEERPVRLVPTAEGERRARYVLRLDERGKADEAWARLAKLDGFTTLKVPEALRPLATVLATADTPAKQPLLVMREYVGEKDGKPKAGLPGRVLVFAGDTSYRWIRNEESQQMHQRFWRQMAVWLAHQEDAEGHVWIRPDVRRLPVRSELGFAVGMRGKGGGPDILDGKFDVEVTAPDGSTSRVPLQRSAAETRGTYTAAREPGVYRLTVRGEGKDPSGGTVSGESSARVIVYDEDLEMTRPAADPEFLRKLATASGGEALRVEQLADFLNRQAETPLERGKPRMELRPDWRTTSWSPFLVWFLVAFAAVVSLEWGLRRHWGLV